MKAIIERWLLDRETSKRVSRLERQLETIMRDHALLTIEHEELIAKVKRLENQAVFIDTLACQGASA